MTRDMEDVPTLLSRARAGDERATTLLLGRYAPWLRELARRKLSLSQQAVYRPSELAQETLIKLAQHLPSFPGLSQEELEAWMRTILSRTLVTRWRFVTAQKRNALENQPFDEARALPAESPSPVDRIIAGQESRVLLQALAQVPEDQRDAVWLHHVDGLSVQEVAEALGRTRFAAAGLIKRGLKNLRRLLSAPPSMEGA